MGPQPDFEEWVAARGPALLRLAYLLTGRPDEAEDLVAQALSRALPRWSRISRKQDLEARVRRLIVSTHLSRLRRLRRRDLPPLVLSVHPHSGEAIELRDVVWEACGSLSPEQRTAVVLRHYADLDLDEIAAWTGTRDGVVRTRVRDAMATISGELADQ